MAIKSRRKVSEITVDGGLPNETSYCRRCKRVKNVGEFYTAVDTFIDQNGYFSVCKTCVNGIFDLINSTEHSIEITILKMCRMLNVKYSPVAIEAAKRHAESMKNKNGTYPPLFGIYRMKLVTTQTGAKLGEKIEDLTYQDQAQIIVNKSDDEIERSEEEKDLSVFWGIKDKEDIQFLENEYNNFKKTHKADTYAEIVLLKEVCQKILEIDKARKAGRDTGGLTKSLQEIMKSLAISPNMSNAASGGKNIDTFGLWVKDIENLKPAEWLEDKSIYKDVDDIEEYGEKYITSPLRAFVTGNKEFDVEGKEIEDEIEEEENDSLSVNLEG